jgi:hypothetical protein
MKRVSFIFATGESWLDRLVTFVTRSAWSHVAFRFDDDGLLTEALAGRGFLLEPVDRFNGWERSQTISCSVSDDSYAAMLVQATRWRQSSIAYGYATCLAIGVKEVFGVWAGRTMLALLEGFAANTLVCSEMLVKLWRYVEPDFLAEQDCRLVSPEQLHRILLQMEDRDKIDKPTDSAYNC